MEIIIKTYNLKEIRKQVILDCIDNNPTLNIDEIAKKLGISERTIQRFIYKIRKIKRVKQCKEGNHRPIYNNVFEDYSCLKCGIKLNEPVKK
jgi:DeoR/GlpR family transcriptional regulator of sugar metabolism